MDDSVYRGTNKRLHSKSDDSQFTCTSSYTLDSFINRMMASLALFLSLFCSSMMLPPLNNGPQSHVTMRGAFQILFMYVCPICCESDRNRVMEALGCGHILCSSCLNHLDCNSGLITCPFCKEQSGRSCVRKLFLNYVEPSRTTIEPP